jgi:hypothetical protein
MNEKRPRSRPKGPRPPKRQFPLKLDEETRAQLTAAAYWVRRSANSIIEEGLAVALRRLQEEHNRGKPFPPRPGQPPPLTARQGVDGNGREGPAPRGKPKRRRGQERAKTRRAR